MNDSPAVSRVPDTRALLAAAAFAGLAAVAPDPFEPLALLLALGPPLLILLAAPADALRVAVLATAIGALGRLPLFQLGVKPVFLRPEELVSGALWLTSGIAAWRAAVRRSASARLLAAFVVIAGVMLAWSATRWGVRGIVPGTLYFARFSLFTVVLPVAVVVGRDVSDRARVARSVLLATTLLSVLGLAQLAFFPDMADLRRFFPAVDRVITDPHLGRLVSTVLDPNLLGAALCLGLALSVARAFSTDVVERRTGALQAGLHAVAIGWTFSRGSLLGAVVAIAVVVLLVRPKLAWGLVPMAAALPFLAPRVLARFSEAMWSANGTPVELLGFHLQPEPSAFARIESWTYTLKVVESAPWTGVGYNNLALALETVGDPLAAYGGSDSSLLLVLATCGPLGLLAFVGVLGVAIRDAFSIRKRSGADGWLGAGTVGAVASLLVTSLFTNALLFPTVLVLLWTLAGLVSAAATTSRADGA